MRDIICAVDMAIETFLYHLKNFILAYQEKQEEKKMANREKLVTIKENLLNVQGGSDALLFNSKTKLATELAEIVIILEGKIKKMEATLNLKDDKIKALTRKLQEKGVVV